MIYNRDQSEVAVLGDIQKFKVGIDERNINHIVTILSSNLYSYPMISFLRETVSNAVDSHIEAKSNEPIIIYRTANDIAIRDHGTGISPERFEEIYLNIGSSTKRQSNDYIGSFGIGRFSVLSVSDLANITSFYEGKAYYYVMNKDIDQLHIDLVDVLPTSEHNGVEVKAPIKSWSPSTLYCLSFIDNIYVESEVDSDLDYVSCFNKRKIHTHKNFKLLNISSSLFNSYQNTEILLGKIPYKVDYRSLWDQQDEWHKSWEYCFKQVYPQLEIGQIDITPNREQLLYSERTKVALRNAYNACIAELVEMWNTETNKEYEDIKEYMAHLTYHNYNILSIDGMEIFVSKELVYDAGYKKYSSWSKIDVKERRNLIQSLYNKDLDLLGRLTHDTLYQGKRQERCFTLKKLINDWLDFENTYKQVIAVPSKAGFSSQYFKGFVKSRYPSNDILFIRQISKHPTPSYIKHFIRSIYGISMLTDSTNLHFVIQLMREVLLYVKSKTVVTDIISSPEYQQYKKDHTIKKTGRVISTEKICFTINTCYNQNLPEKRIMRLDEIIPYIRKEVNKKVQIVCADLNNPLTAAFKGMYYPVIVLSAAQNKMPMLYNGLPEWVHGIESLYSKDNRLLQKVAAIRYINSQYHLNFDAHSCYPEPYRSAIKELSELKGKWSWYKKASYSVADDVRFVINIIPKEKYDPYIMALFNICKPWLELDWKLDNELGLHSINSVNMCVYYLLMKNKKFRMSYTFYKDMKNSINHLLETI